MSEGYIYPHRKAAGKLLAKELTSIEGSKAIILSLPRGGAIIGAEVSNALDAEHDLVICRKIGAPYNPEVAIGALTQDGKLLKDDIIINALSVTKGYLEFQTRLQLKEIKRQMIEFRGEKVFPELLNKTVILVDDGLATGFTMEAAVEFVRSFKPSRIIVAVPVGTAKAITKLDQKADQVVCLEIPEKFWAVGQFYQDFHQVKDEEIKNYLKVKGSLMQKVIALEDGIQFLKPQLEEEGYQVIDLDQNANSADAYVISGMDENITGDMTRIGEGFVVNARGRQPEEILYDLQKHFNLQH